MNCGKLEGSGRGPIASEMTWRDKAVSRHASVSKTNASAKIRTVHLRNTTQKH